MADITKDQVVEYLSNLPVIEVANLVKELEEKWGVSAAPVIQGGPMVSTEEPKEEQTEFDVELTEIGEKKMEVIKTVRTLTQLGLKEAKDAVESAPKVLMEAVSKEMAEEVKKKLEDVGAKVTLK